MNRDPVTGLEEIGREKLDKYLKKRNKRAEFAVLHDKLVDLAVSLFTENSGTVALEGMLQSFRRAAESYSPQGWEISDGGELSFYHGNDSTDDEESPSDSASVLSDSDESWKDDESSGDDESMMGR